MAVSMHLRASFPPKKQDDHATKWRSVTFIGRRGGLDALRLVAAHLSGAASPVNSARLPGFSISPIRPERGGAGRDPGSASLAGISLDLATPLVILLDGPKPPALRRPTKHAIRPRAISSGLDWLPGHGRSRRGSRCRRGARTRPERSEVRKRVGTELPPAMRLCGGRGGLKEGPGGAATQLTLVPYPSSHRPSLKTAETAA